MVSSIRRGAGAGARAAGSIAVIGFCATDPPTPRDVTRAVVTTSTPREVGRRGAAVGRELTGARRRAYRTSVMRRDRRAPLLLVALVFAAYAGTRTYAHSGDDI